MVERNIITKNTKKIIITEEHVAIAKKEDYDNNASYRNIQAINVV